MKRMFNKLREKITFKELPPPYSERVNDFDGTERGPNNTTTAPACEVLDLLANCNISSAIDDSLDTSVEYAEIKDMGLWHSTPLAHRHKSKISLTWVLKENLENAKLTTAKLQSEDRLKTTLIGSELDKNHNQKLNEIERYRKCKSREVKDRVVGRNEYYHNLRFRNACEEFANVQDTYSDTSVGTEEYVRRKHRHRHRRKKRNQSGKFGYDIRDLDSFLTEVNAPHVLQHKYTINAKLTTAKLQSEDRLKTTVIGSELDKNHNQKLNEIERYRKCKSREVKDRVVGRNEYYHNLRFRNACEEFANVQDTYSDTSVGTEEYVRRKHRHRHRRKKRNQSGKFGYDIRDLDSFLTEASIDRPGNIPVVIAYPSTLYQTQKESQQELTLPLGTVVNAVFKNEQWLYAQTPHGDEGYVLYSACLPLGILPNRTSPEKKTPCWESSTDIYPRPCGNLTDNEKEQLRGRTRSECRYQNRRRPKNCAEKDFDTLYLKTKSVCSIDNLGKEKTFKQVRQTLLVVNCDYKGSPLNKTLSVQKGDVVVLVQGGGVETDVDAEWFFVKKRDGTQGFIPAVVAGHGYI